MNFPALRQASCRPRTYRPLGGIKPACGAGKFTGSLGLRCENTPLSSLPFESTTSHTQYSSVSLRNCKTIILFLRRLSCYGDGGCNTNTAASSLLPARTKQEEAEPLMALDSQAIPT